ncbi:MAG: VCBS domain-containing protein [Pirellulaceae bacterium]|nr:VCBS domain-containing protein [Pirellulaceae bacterium]
MNFVRVADKANLSVGNVAATISADDLLGIENAPVTLFARVADPGLTDTHTFFLEWGDGFSTSSGNVVGGIVSAINTFDQDGTYQATLTVMDNAGAIRTQRISIAIGNAAPTAFDDSVNGATEDDGIVIEAFTLLSNDVDPGVNDVLSLVSAQSTSALGATIFFLGEGDLFYDPSTSLDLQQLKSGQQAFDTITYVITDDAGAMSTATVTVTVLGVNEVPIALPDVNTVVEDQTTSVTGNLISNDSDVDAGTALSITTIQSEFVSPINGRYGSLNWNADGSYSYTLDNSKPSVQQLAAGQTVMDVFEYTLFDGETEGVSTLTITITGVNDAPIANSVSDTVAANLTLRVQSSQYDDVVLTDAPVAYWRLSETGGTVAENHLAPLTPDGTIVGAVGFGYPGLVPNSLDTTLRFDGTQHVSFPDSPSINSYVGSASTKTIELWFSADDVLGRYVLYEQGNSANGLNLYISGGELHFGVWNNNAFGPIVKTAVASNIAYHVVAVFNASTAALYVNGPQAASAATAFSVILSHPGENAIGAARTTRLHDGVVNNGLHFVGRIDEVALYNTALSATQVDSHYKAAGLLAGDRDVDAADTMRVSAVNGIVNAVGQFVTLSSGARLNVAADGSYAYDPNHAFDHLPQGTNATDVFTYSIVDSIGASSTTTVTISVLGQNDQPTGIGLSNQQVTNSNTVGTLTKIDIDDLDSHTFQLINDSAAGGSPNFAISGNQLIVIERTGMTLGQQRVLTIQATDSFGATVQQVFGLTVTTITPTVGVSRIVPSRSGVDILFNTALDLSVLNLYDGVDAAVDAADVTLVGASSGSVRGSLLLDTIANKLRFVKTGGLLAADTYTLTLFSRADGFKSLAGDLLDGDSNGVAGGNFVTTFGVTNMTARIISVPDFARGATTTAGQSLNLSFDNGNPGVPVTISDGNDVLAIDFDVVFNPALINFSSTFFNVLPAGWSTTVNLLSAGRMRLTLSGTTPLGSGPQTITRLLGSVPANVVYGASDLVQIENLAVFTQAGGAIAVPSIADPGVHKAIFIGDTNADGIYSAQDAGFIAGVRVGAFTGFEAFSWTDPVIITDVTQSGSLDGLDSSWLSRKGLSASLQPEIPNLPSGNLPVQSGIDPTIAADTLVPGQRGSIANVPIRITDSATGLFGVDVFVDYNTLAFDLLDGLNTSNTQLAGQFITESGWTLDSFVDDGQGKVRLSIYRATPSTSASGQIANIGFAVKATAQLGVSPLIVSGYANVPPFSFSFLNGSINVTQIPATLSRSYVFYNNSGFESFGGVAAALDDPTINPATSKVLLKSSNVEQTTSFSNVSNYSKGINGLVFDVNNLAGTVLLANDFVFRRPAGLVTGTVNPSTWNGVVPVPTLIDVTPGNPSRIRIEWADAAVQNTWLQVILKANANTGLTTPLVFYFGHAAGDVNGVVGTTTPYRVGTTDLSAVQSAVSSALVSIEDARDIDKSRRVGTTDLSFVQSRVSSTPLLRNITIPIAGSAEEGAPPPSTSEVAPRFASPGSIFDDEMLSALDDALFDQLVDPFDIQDEDKVQDDESTDAALTELFSSNVVSEAATNSDTIVLDQLFVELGKIKSRRR